MPAPQPLKATLITGAGDRWEIEGGCNQVLRGIAAVCAGMWPEAVEQAVLEDQPAAPATADPPIAASAGGEVAREPPGAPAPEPDAPAPPVNGSGPKRAWTTAEDRAVLKGPAPGETDVELGRWIGRTQAAIQNRRAILKQKAQAA